VNENKILKLPDNLVDLPNINRFDFEGNKIKFLPVNFVEIQQLEMIGYKNNKGLKLSKVEKKFLKKRKFNFQ
jgi:Leucine-rich repeat (LRR) protein